jgi:hypothetical protein
VPLRTDAVAAAATAAAAAARARDAATQVAGGREVQRSCELLPQLGVRHSACCLATDNQRPSLNVRFMSVMCVCGSCGGRTRHSDLSTVAFTQEAYINERAQ